MGQGGKTNKKVCEVWQVDLEASHRAALENGAWAQKAKGTAAVGRAANVKQARTRAAEAAQWRSRQVFDYDDRTLASRTPIQPSRSSVISSGSGSSFGSTTTDSGPRMAGRKFRHR